MNNINLVGKITKDIILRGSEEKPYCFVTLAVKRKFSDKSDFIDCMLNGKNAVNVSKYSKKGHSLAVSGRLQIESKNKNGTWSTTSTVMVEDITFVQPKETEPHKEEKTLKSFFKPDEPQEEITLSEEIITLANDVQGEKTEEKEIPDFKFPNEEDFKFDIIEDDPFKVFEPSEDDDFTDEEVDLHLESEE